MRKGSQFTRILIHWACVGLGVMGGLLEATGAPAVTEKKEPLGYPETIGLGLVEGVTEYLPISSTGHLILVQQLLLQEEADTSRSNSGVSQGGDSLAKQAIDAYLIILQSGAVVAVLVLYRRRLRTILLGLRGHDQQGLKLACQIMVAFVPSAILGLGLNAVIEAKLFRPVPVAVALGAGVLLMLAVERWRKRSLKNRALQDLSLRDAFCIGLFQCLSLWPGTSRSMATIVGGYSVGLSPKAAAEFSFLLGFVTLIAASLYKIGQQGDALLETVAIGPLFVGWLVAALSAGLAIKGLIALLTRKGLVPFAIYRIGLAIAVLIFA